MRHKGKTVTFDWSNSKDDQKGISIRWASFYSDCEHEVLEVTEGHRLTLTYNLFWVRGNGQLGGHCPWLDPTHLPLYKTVLSLMQEDDLWRNGEYSSMLKNMNGVADPDDVIRRLPRIQLQPCLSAYQ